MAVKIKRERPDQRRHHRVTAPLFVTIDGHELRAADWSLGGLRIENYPGPLPEVGAEVKLGLMLPFQGFDVSFHALSEVVRNDPATAMFAVRFTEIGERERELMQHFIEELVRGSMVDVEDTIQRIDVPVTPASLEPDLPKAGPHTAAPMRRWPVKTLVMSGLYLMIGFVIFGYAGLIGYSNFYRMEVPTAVIAAPVETLVSKADGAVELSDIRPGDRVREGQVIARLLDSALQREIEIADIQVQERKARLSYMKQRQLEELERIRGYATVEMKNVQQTKIELEAIKAQLGAAEQSLTRIRALFDKGYATNLKLDEAQRQVITLKKELDIRNIELLSRIELAGSNTGKRMYSGTETIGNGTLLGDGSTIEAEVRLAEHEIELAQQRYIAHLDQRERDAVRAPFDGTVLEVKRGDGSAVRRGDVIAIVEQRRDRNVTAFLTQDEVMKVGLGDEVLLYIPALGETLEGRVRSIDRTSAFVREQDVRQNPGYTWRGPTDRSAKVVLEFKDPGKVADFERYRSGLPVVAVFEQRTTNSLLSALLKKLSLSL